MSGWWFSFEFFFLFRVSILARRLNAITFNGYSILYLLAGVGPGLQVAQPLPFAVNIQWMRGLSADATVLDLLDSGCLPRTPPHCHSVVKPQRHPVQVPALPD